MYEETITYDLNDFSSRISKCGYNSTQVFPSFDNDNEDEKDRLVAQSKELLEQAFQENKQEINKHFKVSSDRNSKFALEMALSDERLQNLWCQDDSIEDLLIRLSQTDLSSVKLLVEKMNEIVEVAYVYAMEGKVISLAILLMIAPEKVTVWIIVLRPMGSKEMTTIYECLLREALLLGQKGESSKSKKRFFLSNFSDEKRKSLLCEIELLQLFGATVTQRGGKDRKMISSLIRASQAGDEAILKLILKTKLDVNETDAEGNSALHWCLKNPNNNKQSSVVSLLLEYGATASQRNNLGLTPLHVAAANGYFAALQILLLKDPSSVDARSEMKETPLFFAVKNDFENCAKLLLRYGASTQIFNLRKQRPIDLARSQDMRSLLSPVKIGTGKSTLPVQFQESISYWVKRNLQFECDKEMSESLFSSPKTEICRYFESPSGCVRGTKCYFAHGAEELLGSKSKQLDATYMALSHIEGANLKIFVGGLPPSVDSESLEEFFETKFGAVDEAVVIGSQAGDQVHSRGFGFVTFKHEESVAAAVQAHYVIISGKRVEIKGAVPKEPLQGDFPKTGSTPTVLKQENNDKKHESWVDKLLNGKKQTISHESTKKGNPNSTNSVEERNQPSWLTTFKKWLPGFMVDVTKRLKEGEWYPLSSLKSDFRATCGLELDHASVGHAKLSDFMRSIPNLCRMKIVPVGDRGAATHMVLLPNKKKHITHQTTITEKQRPVSSSTCSNCSSLAQVVDDTEDNEECEIDQLIKDMYSEDCRKFGYISRVVLDEGKSSSSSSPVGDQEKQQRNDTSNNFYDSIVQRFLERDPIFHDRPWNQKNQEHDGCLEESRNQQQPRHVIALAHSKANYSFTYVARQPDLFKNYRRSISNELSCSTCLPYDKDRRDSKEKKKMIWVNKPCGHMMGCSDCKHWVNRQGISEDERDCMYCGARVEKCEIQPWGAASAANPRHIQQQVVSLDSSSN